MDRRDHWQRVYTTPPEQPVSWFERVPALSLNLMEHAGLTPDTCVLDVGARHPCVPRHFDCAAVTQCPSEAIHGACAAAVISSCGLLLVTGVRLLPQAATSPLYTPVVVAGAGLVATTTIKAVCVTAVAAASRVLAAG